MASLHVAVYKIRGFNVPHWCLYTVDDNGDEMIFEALGPTGGPYQYHTQHTTLQDSLDISETPKVGRIEADVWPEISTLLKGLPLGGTGDKGWNCQSWVREAIAALSKIGYLERDEGAIERVQEIYQKKWTEYNACVEDNETSW
jgi:hypothetical protein